MSRLTPPDLAWEEGIPRSAAYGDVYYSAQDGLAETRHVFLAANHLPARMQGRAHFCVGETGFGTGLNLLALWQMWDALPEPKPRLHFITLDRHPLAAEDMARAHASWPELAEYSAQLLAAIPPPFPGPHRCYFAEGRLCVDFLWGEAADMLARYAPAEGRARVDAWFLDGFSPAKNPDMWHEALYAQLARLSTPEATIATFTSAGHVRRGLIAAGFAVQRAPGFGRKREMLAGARNDSMAVPSVNSPALVIGAGIAGCGVAWRLAGQGREVVLLEAGTAPGAGASGNPAAAFLPYFTLDWSLRGRIYANGFAQSRHLYEQLRARGHTLGETCGAIALAMDDETRLRQQKRTEALALPEGMAQWVEAAEASDLAGVKLPFGGLHYPQAGWVQMRTVCDALLAEAGANVQLRANSRVQRLWHENAQWCVALENGETLRSDLVVLANGHEAARLLPQLGIEPVRGQLIRFAPPPPLAGLRKLLNFKHTLMPAIQGRSLLGSSFVHHDAGMEYRPEEAMRPLNDLRCIFPEIEPEQLLAEAEPWIGIRAAQARRMPLVGPAPGQPEGLYLHLAHGARGTLSGLQPFASTAF